MDLAESSHSEQTKQNEERQRKSRRRSSSRRRQKEKTPEKSPIRSKTADIKRSRDKQRQSRKTKEYEKEQKRKEQRERSSSSNSDSSSDRREAEKKKKIKEKRAKREIAKIRSDKNKRKKKQKTKKSIRNDDLSTNSTDTSEGPGSEDIHWDLVNAMWPLETRPEQLQNKRTINKMSIGEIVKFKEHFEKEEEKRGVGSAIFGRDQKLKPISFEAMTDDGKEQLHPARFSLRQPIAEPKKFWDQVTFSIFKNIKKKIKFKCSLQQM